MPIVAAIVYHLRRHGGKITDVDVKDHLLAKPIEEVSDLGVAPKPVLDNLAFVEVPYIIWGVDQVVHEDYVGGDFVAAFEVTLLESYQVEEERPCPIMDHKLGDLEAPALELDVPELVCLPLVELDPSFSELCHAVDELLLPL